MWVNLFLRGTIDRVINPLRYACWFKQKDLLFALTI